MTDLRTLAADWLDPAKRDGAEIALDALLNEDGLNPIESIEERTVYLTRDGMAAVLIVQEDGAQTEVLIGGAR